MRAIVGVVLLGLTLALDTRSNNELINTDNDAYFAELNAKTTASLPACAPVYGGAPATGPCGAAATCTVAGIQWTRVYSCCGSTFDVNADAQSLAAQASFLRIYRGSDGAYAESTADGYPLQQLKAGKTISFPASGYATQALVASTWKAYPATSDLLSRMWNSCGSASAFSDAAFWACNNGNGLHLFKNQYCDWDWSHRDTSPQTQNTIWVGVDTNPCHKTTGPCGTGTSCAADGFQWQQIYSCCGSTGAFTPNFKTLVANADAIRIYDGRNGGNTYVQSKPGSYPVAALKAGGCLAYPPAGGYADNNTIAGAWTGPADNLGRMWNSCGNNRGIDHDIYWACNNQNGLHIIPAENICTWNWPDRNGPNAPISVWIGVDTNPCHKHTGPCNGADTSCTTADGYSWARVYSCCGADHEFAANYQAIAAKADTVRIYDGRLGGNAFVQSKPNTFPLAALRAGTSLSYPPTGYATDAIIRATWTGPEDNLQRMNNSCGNNQGADTGLYWACNNQGGLHLLPTQGICTWNWQERAGPFAPHTVWVGTAPAPPPPPPAPAGYQPSGYQPSGYQPPAPSGYQPSGYQPPAPSGYQPSGYQPAPAPAGYVPPPPKIY